MEIDKLSLEISDYLKSLDLKLYKLSYIKKDNTIQIMLDESLDLDKLENVSNQISEYMDGLDIDLDNYLLDITNVGIEKPIETKEDIDKAIGQYVFIKTKTDSINGTLVKFADDKVYIEYLDKTRKKIKEFDYQEIKQLRYAVKF